MNMYKPVLAESSRKVWNVELGDTIGKSCVGNRDVNLRVTSSCSKGSVDRLGATRFRGRTLRTQGLKKKSRIHF